MRMLMIKKDMDLQALSARFAYAPLGGAKVIEEITRLNPHVDLNELKVGTVILLPDGADTGDDDGPTIARDFFEVFGKEATRAVRDAGARAAANLAAVVKERGDVFADELVEGLKSPEKALLDAARQRHQNEDLAAKESKKAFELIQHRLTTELKALAKLLQ